MDLLFDVESTKLHGTAFAVGAVVFQDGAIVDALYVLSRESEQHVTPWVRDNVLPAQGGALMVVVETDREMRDMVYEFFQKHQTAKVWADVPYPVETNFLEAIYRDDPNEREWTMPYPLYDITSFKNGCGVPQRNILVENTLDYQRMSHNPVHDCIVSYETSLLH